MTANGQNYNPYDKSIENFQQPESESVSFDELQNGENLNGFAARNNITLKRLFELNSNITDIPLMLFRIK
ncbi:hypothetical protein [Enterococcus termitis]|uniref:LysM domain-containing protein n=1 Tax=Enterococcus termitis TaxID=332950 RepID=A0A1E5GSU2_9ENTE|nr:hypothetical protein [Enterococcus termitis]OEG15771.1 hypothetical protein BCR25_18665 [Enterococcus termitis]